METKTRRLVPIEEVAHILGVGRSTVYILVGEGKLSRVHIGRRSLIDAASNERYVDSLTSIQDGASR